MEHDVRADTWVATDGAGRDLPGFAECGPPRCGRSVGLFYFICNNHDGPDAPRDVTKMLAANPANPGFEPDVAHYWGEPEMGYYRSSDRWAIRRHAYMLADAGVDTLIFDLTNDATFPEAYTAVCETFRQVRGEGERTPDICFLASEQAILRLWEDLYKPGRFADLWFQWKGKPLLIFGQWEKRGDMNAVQLPQEITDFFTIRRSWAWDSLPWYGDEGRHRWPWVAHYPQCVGWDEPGVAEQVPVAICQHPVSGIGRSFHSGAQPETDIYDATPLTPLGPHFAEQWRRALEVDPEFVFITGWNEWMAGANICDDVSQAALQAKWDFFPGAVLGRASRPLKLGDLYFIDQYNQEFSRDAEPMRGGHTDNYYYQMVAGIRLFKGVRPPEPTSGARAIDIEGGFDQWDCVQPTYRDHLYETLERNEPGWGSAGPYTNPTGRNEFTTLKVTHDADYIYFLACTRAPLTPPTDPNWMQLFLRTTRDHAAGWEGYDRAVNLLPPEADGCTAVLRSEGGWNWRPSGAALWRAEGARLMLAVPRSALGLEQGQPAFDFHWADNIQRPGEIEQFFISGDSAPARRFNYRYDPGA